MLHSMDFTHISPFIPYLLLSTFLKCIALLLITALIQPCLHKLSSNSKHQFWLALLVIIALMPVFSLVVPPGFLPLKIQSAVSPRALRILDAVLPRYNELGGQVQSASGMSMSASVRQSQIRMFTWEAVCVMFWLTGTIYFLARVIIGKFGIKRMRNDTRTIEDKSIMKTLAIVLKEFKIRRNVQVLTSCTCRVPFTYGTFKPIILLPPGAASWPVERLRSVLIHELAHVKRLDSLTQQFARIVYAFFWFVPMAWIAYRNLHIEQEKSCDEYAVDSGIEAERYARHILNVVRFARGRLLLTGIYFSRGKRKMLEKRILHLLRFDRMGVISRKWVPIVTVMLCVLLIVPVLVSHPISADDREYIMQDNEELYGTWINPDYDETFNDGKIIHEPDGVLRAYDSATSKKDAWNAKYTITDRWVDVEGNIWYKWLLTEAKRGAISDTDEYCCLSKISDSGRVQERSISSYDYPTEIKPDSFKYDYRIYYRQ